MAFYFWGGWGISQHLTRARQSIDRALLSMKSNGTKNMSQELVGPALTAAAITQNNLIDRNQNRRSVGGTQSNRSVNGRTTTALVNGNSIGCVYIYKYFLCINRAKIS